MALANASLLDEGTAAAEAMTLARRASKAPDGAAFVIDADCHPQTIEVVRTRAEPLGLPVVVAPVVAPDGSVSLPDGDVFGVLVQEPSSTGAVRDLSGLVAAVHDRGGLVDRGRRPARAVPAAPAGRGRRRRRGRVPRSASACRSATAGRTPATWRCGRACSARCPGGSSACRSTPTATRPTASPSRPASSTSAGRRRRATSAPRRCSWPWSPRCTPCTTGPRACGRSPRRCTARPCRLAVGAARRRGRGGPRRVLRHGGRAGPRPGGGGRGRRPVEPASTSAWSTTTPSVVACDETTTDVHLAAVCAAFERRPGRCRHDRAGDGRRGDPRSPAPHLGDAHPPDLPPVPVRDRDAALPAPAGRQGRGPRPLDDPARLLHDEAERDHGDGADQLARLRRRCTRSPRSTRPWATPR